MISMKEILLPRRRVSNRTLLFVFIAVMMMMSAGIVTYSNNVLNLVYDKRHGSLDVLEDISSMLQTEIHNRTKRPRYSVLKALIRDGYNPIALSVAYPRSDDARIKQVNDAKQTTVGAISRNATLVPRGYTTPVPHSNTTLVPRGYTTPVPHSNTTLVPHSNVTLAPPSGTTLAPPSTTTLTLPSTTTLAPSTDDLIVPNVVHYVLTGPNKTFQFMSYLSFLSVDRFIKPEQIFVHGDSPPSGDWWNATVHQVRNIFYVQRPYMDSAPNGFRYRFPAHSSDYARAEILVRYGGIYLDPDVIVLKSFDPLRKYPTVIGRETETGLCNGIMIAQRGALFLRLLLEQYRSYTGSQEEWARKSVYNLHDLARLYPHLIHVEETSLNRPNWKEKGLIYDGRHDWTRNYAIHTWIRVWPPEKRPRGADDVRNLTTTLGEIARLVLRGSPQKY